MISDERLEEIQQDAADGYDVVRVMGDDPQEAAALARELRTLRSRDAAARKVIEAAADALDFAVGELTEGDDDHPVPHWCAMEHEGFPCSTCSGVADLRRARQALSDYAAIQEEEE